MPITRRRIFFLIGFARWGKTSILKDLLGKESNSRFSKKNPFYSIGGIGDYLVADNSNDDKHSTDEYIEYLKIILSKSKDCDLIATLCPVKKKSIIYKDREENEKKSRKKESNDINDILNIIKSNDDSDDFFKSGDIDFILIFLQHKYDLKESLDIADINNYLKLSNSEIFKQHIICRSGDQDVHRKEAVKQIKDVLKFYKDMSR